jgi:hypothetical protein
MAHQKGPVLLVIKASSCPACARLQSIWPQLEPQIRQAFPDIRIQMLELPNVSSDIDVGSWPAGLRVFTGGAAWFPSLVLISGSKWDQARERLGPNNPITFDDSIILNGKWVNGSPVHEQHYNFMTAGGTGAGTPGIIDWLRANYQNIIRGHNDAPPMPGLVPPRPGIQPLMPAVLPVNGPPIDRGPKPCASLMRIVPYNK